MSGAVHVAVFAQRAGLDAVQLRSLVRGGPDDACWKPEETMLVRFCDGLHAGCDVDAALWSDLRAKSNEEAVLELLPAGGLLPRGFLSQQCAQAAARAVRGTVSRATLLLSTPPPPPLNSPNDCSEKQGPPARAAGEAPPSPVTSRTARRQ
jgi:hypothetical protein